MLTATYTLRRTVPAVADARGGAGSVRRVGAGMSHSMWSVQSPMPVAAAAAVAGSRA